MPRCRRRLARLSCSISTPGQQERIGNFPNMAFSPRFSPDGLQVVLSLQQGGNANIYRMDLRTKQMTRLTNSPSIDTAPSFSPDGTQIAFESDRGGRAAALCHERWRWRGASASASAAGGTARRSGRRAATSSPLPSRRAASSRSA